MTELSGRLPGPRASLRSLAAATVPSPSPAESYPDRPLRSDAPAYLLFWLGALFFNMFSGHTAELGFPVGPDRACIAASLLLLLLDRDTWRRFRLVVSLAMVAMLALTCLVAWSASEHGTLTNELGAFAILDRIVVPFTMFLLAPVVFSTPGRRLLLLRLLVVMGAYLGLTAVFERVGPSFLIYPRYIDDPSVGLQFGRARGPFVESVANGVVISVCGFAAAYATTQLRGRWRVLAALAAASCSVGAILTLTRSIWIGAGVGILLAVLGTKRYRRLLPAVLVSGALLVMLALLAFPGLMDDAGDRSSSERSVDDRRNTNAAALRVVEQHPLTGVGWARFLSEGSDYVRQDQNYPVTSVVIEVHNVVLSRAAELGLPGAALFVLVVLVSLGRAALARAPAALEGWRFISIGAVTVWFFAAMLSPLAPPLPNQLVWTIAGVTLGPSLIKLRPQSKVGG
jgi:putative inorganic carbon (HCO3(-)) transporter